MRKRNATRFFLLGLMLSVLWAGMDITPSWAKGKEMSGVVNINTATADQLQLLPGIGKVKADAIIAYRTATPFNAIDDLEKVKGIGKATLEKLRPNITVSGDTTAVVTGSPNTNSPDIEG